MAFRHRASAAAFGGYLSRPFKKPLPTQASSVLAPVGGFATARVDDYRFQEIVSFTAGYTQVMGSRRTNAEGQIVHETLAEAVVEGLNILDIVTADRVVSRLTSAYVEGVDGDEPPYLPIGSYFLNLRIAGTLIGDPTGVLQVRPYLLEEKCGKTAMLERRAVESCKPFCDVGGKELKGLPPAARLPLFDLSKLNVPVASKQAGYGGTIEIPTFGSVTVGEYIVRGGERTLTMLVVDLHSPEEGELTVGPVEGNGDPG